VGTAPSTIIAPCDIVVPNHAGREPGRDDGFVRIRRRTTERQPHTPVAVRVDADENIVSKLRVAAAKTTWVVTRSVLGEPKADPLTAFVHIPKTAGKTATAMLSSAYPSGAVRNAGNYLRYPEKTPAKLRRARWTGTWTGARVIVGHIPYGLFRDTLPRGTRYVTFLRDPVERVLSHYHRHVQRKSATESLEEALETHLPEVNNLATRFLCGDPAPLGELAPGALDDAKATLREFACVGIQERFDASVVLLQRTLGLGPVPYVNEHVSSDRPDVDELPPDLYARIEEANQLDIELYAYARGLFEDAVTACDDRFMSDVEELRASSAEANERAIQAARDWLESELPPGRARPRVALYADAEAAGIPRSALKHVIERSSVRKTKARGGEMMLTLDHPDL
jgi:hypothetical protein